MGTPVRAEVSMSRPDMPKAPSPIKFRQNLSGLAIFAPIIAAVIFFGVYPAPLLDVMAVSVENLISQHTAAIEASGAVMTAGR